MITLEYMHQEAFNKLKLLTVSNRLFGLSERYVKTGLSYSVLLVVRMVKEYREGFESSYIELFQYIVNRQDKSLSPCLKRLINTSFIKIHYRIYKI
ncbi:hypothetical protein BpHYR1_017981 [Brachionus plicatilis]|uniref:Uncharacterized protein n=1 Tax=Brachionus plicatilis TaxID=10195 RepID=A0A3M7SKC2_BRAPC|nr:hypothetical protein BpHYR1_017981 [Brachionus plicatilis]